jgi:hypothetical protein
MQQIKRKHHYVWKEYLKSWSNNDQVFAFLKSTKKLIKSNTEGVGQERFFYGLEVFTEEEEIVLKELVESWSNDSVREINLEFYHIFTSYSKIKRALTNKDLSTIDNEKLKHQLDLLKANTMEESHTIIEAFGKKLIKISKFEDLRFLEETNELLSTMIYISFQYLRTRNMREIIKPIMPKYSYLSEKFLNIFPFIYATAIADSLTHKKTVRFIYLNNQTDVDFITSDQPIINEKKHILNDEGTVAQLNFYYPIHPGIALVIHYQEQQEKYKYVNIEKLEVEKYNLLMFNNAREFVFATSEDQLILYNGL